MNQDISHAGIWTHPNSHLHVEKRLHSSSAWLLSYLPLTFISTPNFSYHEVCRVYVTIHRLNGPGLFHFPFLLPSTETLQILFQGGQQTLRDGIGQSGVCRGKGNQWKLPLLQTAMSLEILYSWIHACILRAGTILLIAQRKHKYRESQDFRRASKCSCSSTVRIKAATE